MVRVGGVAVAVVDVVDVVAVRNGDMSTAGAVLVGVGGVLDVCWGLALVEMAVVFAVQVTVVDVVDVVLVRNGDVTAGGAVDMGVLRMFGVCGGHRLSLSGSPELGPVLIEWS
jgi:hypothetical protein